MAGRTPAPQWVIVVAALLPVQATACPFCVSKAETLTAKIRKADFAALCRPVDPIANGSAMNWHVERSLSAKTTPKSGSTVVVAKPISARQGERRLLLADRRAGQLVVRRSLHPPEARLLDFVAGGVAALESSDPGKWAYYVDGLTSGQQAVAEEAFNELAGASVAELHWASPRMAVERIKTTVLEESTPADHVGMLGLFVGIAGRPSDAGFLKRALTAPSARLAMGIDGMLGGLFLLDARDATRRSLALLTGAGKSEGERRAALRALQFALIEGLVADRSATLQSMRSAVMLPGVGELTLDELRYQRVWNARAEAFDLAMRAYSDHRPPPLAAIRFFLADSSLRSRDEVDSLTKRFPQALADARHSLRFEAQLRDEWIARNIGRKSGG